MQVAFSNSLHGFQDLIFNFELSMWLRNKRPHNMVYSVDRKGAKSGGKVANAIKHYKFLLKRIEFEGNTKRTNIYNGCSGW